MKKIDELDYKSYIDVQRIEALKKNIIMYQNNINNILNNVTDVVEDLSKMVNDDNYVTLSEKQEMIKVSRKNIMGNLNSYIEDLNNALKIYNQN